MYVFYRNVKQFKQSIFSLRSFRPQLVLFPNPVCNWRITLWQNKKDKRIRVSMISTCSVRKNMLTCVGQFKRKSMESEMRFSFLIFLTSILRSLKWIYGTYMYTQNHSCIVSDKNVLSSRTHWMQPEVVLIVLYQRSTEWTVHNWMKTKYKQTTTVHQIHNLRALVCLRL